MKPPQVGPSVTHEIELMHVTEPSQVDWPGQVEPPQQVGANV
jgi:hypothetical protein